MTPPRIAVLLLLATSSSCASDRAHWSGGRKYDLLETSRVQVRRSRQQVDRASGELELAWVAARARDGAPDLESVELCVFADADGDGIARAAEIVEHRESRERARKVQFSALRFPWKDGAPALTARIVVRTVDGIERVEFELRPD